MTNTLTELQGVRLLVTRAAHQVESFAKQIEQYGGIPVNVPLITIAPPHDEAPIEAVLTALSDYDWLVLTSSNGVDAFVHYAERYAAPTWKNSLPKVAAVGKKTLRALEAQHIAVDFVPTEYTADVLFDELAPSLAAGTNLLLARGNLARMDLPEQLKGINCNVDDVVIYRTARNDAAKAHLKEIIFQHQVDVITFTSPSTVRHFAELLDGEAWHDAIARLPVACIGPITAQEAEKYHYPNILTAEEYTIEGLLHTIATFFNSGRF
ncbi:uroporphyrinogen-III synthase [Bacillus tianshenii]|nr:uroporphyrinogen-III synthase [Bacillus tianshenii]